MFFQLINGPNLNLLGQREPDKYGSENLATVVTRAQSLAESLGLEFSSFQSNSEGAIVDRIHCTLQHSLSHADEVKDFYIVINPGALTHTSIAIRDALLGVSHPFIEVHISNIHAREPFRHHSYLSDQASGIIVGLGTFGYEVAIQHASKLIAGKQKQSELIEPQ